MSLTSKDASKADGVGAMPTQIVKDLTADKLLQDFLLLQERWEDTALAAQIKGLIQGKRGEGREWGVTSAVCIGIGSFSRDWAHRWRSLWQLVLFFNVVDLLRKEDESMEITCFAQDPAFTPLDTEFLSLLSISTLESDLQTKITSSSFVYSPFVDWFLLLPTFLAGRNPVLYAGNEILDDYGVYAQSVEKKERLEECNEVGRRWLEQREVLRLREFEKHGNALDGMVVYLRVGVDNEKEGGKEETADGAKEEAGEVKEEASDEAKERAEDDTKKEQVGFDSRKEKFKTERKQGCTHSAEQNT